MKRCESIPDEFNMFYCFREFTPYHKGCFADIGASLILAQKSPLDMLMHYGVYPHEGIYSVAFVTDVDGSTLHFASYETMKDFGVLYRLGTEVKTAGDIDGRLNILAAADDDRQAVMLVS